uniref:Uncharacterized protein n=1 Tax=Peronospora matthiolae TaxID=2874970 RepID=A0AAV1UC60_9STRA
MRATSRRDTHAYLKLVSKLDLRNAVALGWLFARLQSLFSVVLLQVTKHRDNKVEVDVLGFTCLTSNWKSSDQSQLVI